jgi:DNA-binding NarL/FixJ family response regulator
MATRLILADDQPIVLHGLAQRLRLEPDFRVMAGCTDGLQALVAARRYLPDVLIIKTRLPGKDGLAVLRELGQEGSGIKGVLIADRLEDETVLEAFRMGVRGMLLQRLALQMVVQCIRTVQAGQPWFERHASQRALEVLLRRDHGHGAQAGHLTLRETELVRMIARGIPTREISQHLAISVGTVKTHLHRVYRKLRVANRVGLTLYAKSANLV